MRFNETTDDGYDEVRTTNFEGGEAFAPDSPELGLYKVVINNLLDDTYYESDEDSLQKVRTRFERCAEANPEFVLKLAKYARGYKGEDGEWQGMSLRQIPQLLLVLAANHEDTKPYVRDYAEDILYRADEPLEALAMQATLFGKTVPKPLKKGITDALHNYDAYQFAKYDSANREWQYRDLLNLVHPAPRDEEHDDIFERIALGELDDHPEVEKLTQHRTWENEMSKDDDRSKEEVFRERLEADDMGLFAKIRNVRNMREAGIEGRDILTEEDLESIPYQELYPFRFYQAYKALKPSQSRGLGWGNTNDGPTGDLSTRYLDDWFERAIDASLGNLPPEMADTYVSADMSGSMGQHLSNNSTMTCMELSALFAAVCAKKGAAASAFARGFETFSFHGSAPILSMQDKIMGAEVGASTNGHLAVEHLTNNGIEYSNVVLFTDEQLWNSGYGRTNSLKEAWDEYTAEVAPDANLYVVDLASYGDLSMPEGYHNVYQVSGWSEAIIDHIQNASREDAAIRAVEAVEPAR